MAPFRILLIAPDTAGLDIAPEVSDISGFPTFRVTVLTGHLNIQRLYATSRSGDIDLIHLAVHSDNDFVSINGDKLGPDELSQIVKLSGAQGVFFNSCTSGKLASFLVGHGYCSFAIFNNIQLKDSDAWKVPLLFYASLNEQLERGERPSIPSAFYDAAPATGDYGLVVSPEKARLAPIQMEIERLAANYRLLLFLVLLNLVLTLALAWTGYEPELGRFLTFLHGCWLPGLPGIQFCLPGS
jgi:hypothetical protein